MANIRGLAFPIELTSKGGLKLAEDGELVASHIRALLSTDNLERILRPEFGTPALVFEVLNAPEITAERIRLALIAQITESVDFDVWIDESLSIPEEGTVVIQVDWTLNGQTQAQLSFDLLGG